MVFYISHFFFYVIHYFLLNLLFVSVIHALHDVEWETNGEKYLNVQKINKHLIWSYSRRNIYNI
jgi:hypothetical protein